LTGEKRRRAWLWCAPGLVASLVAMLLMVLSPSNEWRQAALPPPASAWVLISYTFRYTFDFLRYSLRGQPLPHLILLALAAVASFLTLGAAAEKISWKRLLLVTLIVSFILIGAILCSVAPSVYAGVQYPAPRALMPANFLLLVLLVVIGMAVGLALRMGWKEPARWAMVLALLLMVVLLAYPVRSFSQASADQLTLSVKAARWDVRQVQIEAQLSNGQRDLQVKEVDVVQGLEDLGPKPDAWVNQCAAGYYGVHTITALP
jgi:hypothetical protein